MSYQGRFTFVALEELDQQALHDFYQDQSRAYDNLCGRKFNLDLTRGKPSRAQLDLSAELLKMPGAGNFLGDDGTDARNYGGPQGLLELRRIFSDVLQVPVEQLLAGGNASLALMHDNLVFALLHGTPDSQQPWSQLDRIAFLCPTPGYDRHFSLCEQYGVEMIPIDLHDDGPDMSQVRQYIGDPAVKGMWLVPTYSNPTGAVISDAKAAELASMATAASDFRLIWDNAYAVHSLGPEHIKTPDILGLCDASGNGNRPLIFGSTSKITFAGAGVSFMGASVENIQWFLANNGKRIIGPDKINQLRHARYLRDVDGVYALMDKHRHILAPKFELVTQTLEDRLSEHEIATWTYPKGGYFVSLDVSDGTATRVVQLCKDAGIALTPAGASFPYRTDPRDRNIRIAPSYPDMDDLANAMDGLCTCILLAAAEQYVKQ